MEVWPSFCATSGQRVDRGDKFCRNCGAPVPQQPFESAGTMARPAFAEPEAATETVPHEAPQEPAPASPQPAEAQPQAEKTDPPVVFSSLPTAYDYVEPEVIEPPRRRSRPPVLEILVIVLLLAGAGAAVWMLRSSLPAKHAAVPSNVDVLLSPATARVAVGRAVDFVASVTGSDNVEVDWTVQEGEAGGRVVPRGAKASGGVVSSLAVYIAPDSPGTYHLLATSKADPAKSASAEITVKA